MRSRSISAWNSLVWPPSTSTSETPGTRRSRRSTTQSCRVRSSHGVHARRADELIAVDFADGAGRRDHRLHLRRQRRLGETVERLLANEMVVAAIFELQADKAEREHRVGADELQPGRAGDRDLDRDGDVALNLLRRLAGVLRDDLDDRRRGIRIRLDVELQEGGIAQRQKRREAISTSGRRDRHVEIRLRIMGARGL